MGEKKTPINFCIRKSIAILVVLLLMATLPVASATITTIQPSSADSYIYEYSPSTNYGTLDYMYISPLCDPLYGYKRRGIVKFDLSSIPSGAQVTSATLYLREHSTQGTTRTIGVHRVTSSWTEDGVTWNSRDGTNNWGTAGGDFISTATDEQSISWTGALKWDSWDVTSDVRGFVNGTYPNYGWIIKDENEGAKYDCYWQFKSKEDETASLRPKLEVTYRLVTSCDVNGNEVNEFAPGESVYVKAEGLDANADYKIWIQDDPVGEGDALVPGEDPSGTLESVTTDGSGNFGPTLIWTISSDAPVTHHEYDIVVNKGTSEEGQTYNAADDGLDSASVAGIVAPVPDVSSLILFASGLVLVLMYFVYGRRRKEEGGKMRMIKKQTPRVDIRKSIAILAVLLLMATLPVASAQQKATPITNCTELQSINNDLSGDYYLANDIDCSEHKNFDPIGLLEKPFTGTFDGKGYKITNLYINRPETNYIGLFGIIASGAKSRMLAWKRLV